MNSSQDLKICVFSSSSDAIDAIYVEEAVRLSAMIGQSGNTLINGGANVGLMEKMLVAAKNAGGKTIGIIPEKLKQFGLESKNADEIIIASDMMERKAIMREMSDAFVALPGGFGTLEEILEVITLKQLDYHQKAIVFINTNGFYDDLFKQFERSYEENFAKPAYRSLYQVVSTSKEVMDYLSTYQPTIRENKWYKVPVKS